MNPSRRATYAQQYDLKAEIRSTLERDMMLLAAREQDLGICDHRLDVEANEKRTLVITDDCAFDTELEFIDSRIPNSRRLAVAEWHPAIRKAPVGVAGACGSDTDSSGDYWLWSVAASCQRIRP